MSENPVHAETELKKEMQKLADRRAASPTAEEDAAMVRRGLAAGLTKSAIAAHMGVSRTTVYNIIEKAGLEGAASS